YLKRDEGERWRRAVYLNTERMLREDSGSVGPTALLICLLTHGWAGPDERRLDQLFDGLWQQREALGPGLTQLASLAVEAQPGSATAAYWRAKLAHAHDPVAGLAPWRALLELENVPRGRIHEA